MINTLKIIKKSTKVFWHIHNDLETQKFAISDFEISLDGDKFKIIEIDGAKRYVYSVENITIIDETGAGVIEHYLNAETLYNRLIAINYTPFYNPLTTSSSDNTIISESGFSLTGNNLTVNANWIWKLLGITYSNPINEIITIPLCATGNKRVDYVVPNDTNGFTRISGTETTEIPAAPSIPNKNMYVTYFTVSDSLIEETANPNVGNVPGLNDVTTISPYSFNPISIKKQDNTEGVSILSFALSMWKRTNSVSQFVNFLISNITESYNVQFPNKTGGAVQTMAMISDVTKAQVGLGNADNTSDANKPISTAAQTALNAKADLINGFVPQSQLPSYVDDVLEFANLASFPATGEIGKIYIALDSSKQYRWSGSAYLQITNGLIATTNDVPEGSSNLYFTVARFLANLTAGNVKTALGISVLSGSNTGDQDISGKENTANKTDVVIGNETSSTKYGSVKAMYDWAVAKFQAVLVSGTNIKTVNGNTLLGSGDLVTFLGGVIDVATSTYQLLLTDNGKSIVFSNATSVALTIPLNATVAFPIGSKIDLVQQGNGVVTLTTTGLTIISNSPLFTIKGQIITLIKTAINSWSVVGNDMNGEIRLPAYPSTRNDGQIPSNRVLSTDVNGNLKMYTIATAPPPYLEVLVPDSTLPSTTTNFTLKGAFFTPTMTVSIVGQTVNYISFVSDNLVKVNVTTGATYGSYAVTLNNGISATFNNALLIFLGTVFTPLASDFVNLIQPVTVEDGSVLLKTVNSYGTAELPYTFNFAKKFRIYYSHKVSPLWVPTGEIQVDFIRITDLVNGNYWDLYLHTNNSSYSEYKLFKNGVLGGFNGLGWTAPTYINRDVFFYWDLTQMYIYVNNSLQWTFPVGEFPNPIKVAFKVGKMDIKNIKYVELAS